MIATVFLCSKERFCDMRAEPEALIQEAVETAKTAETREVEFHVFLGSDSDTKKMAAFRLV